MRTLGLVCAKDFVGINEIQTAMQIAIATKLIILFISYLLSVKEILRLFYHKDKTLQDHIDPTFAKLLASI